MRYGRSYNPNPNPSLTTAQLNAFFLKVIKVNLNTQNTQSVLVMSSVHSCSFQHTIIQSTENK